MILIWKVFAGGDSQKENGGIVKGGLVRENEGGVWVNAPTENSSIASSASTSRRIEAPESSCSPVPKLHQVENLFLIFLLFLHFIMLLLLMH